MSECKQCPHVVGDITERDCAFPYCGGGWEAAFKSLTAENAELKEHAKEMLDDLNGYADIEEKLLAKIKNTDNVVKAARKYINECNRHYSHTTTGLDRWGIAETLKQLDEVRDER